MIISLTKSCQSAISAAEIYHLGSLLDFKITMCIFFLFFFLQRENNFKAKSIQSLQETIQETALLYITLAAWWHVSIIWCRFHQT